MNHVAWALLGMAGYSATTMFVKLATRTGTFGAFAVLSIATSIVAIAAAANAYLGGAFADKSAADFLRPGALYAYAAGIVLTVAVGSLFKALSLGPASVVVPIYGMFILGGAFLGIAVLGEPLTSRKILGLLLAAAGVYFVAV
ncbi:EamA family transporter [Methylobacterium sp. WL64]|uniref:EamA family transporter n=1 Tax=Methylobacterium sp. WL64 TaxID=2603894 RepID=UPI0011C9039E|nr:EamA family transporter [Methylobacterium sp. WL64]TXN00740.1 EamA family transporter [Methylobacterium sp. WL64]